MKIFIESIDKGIWDAVKNVPFVYMLKNDKVISEKPWCQWTEHESKKAQYDCIAKNIIIYFWKRFQVPIEIPSS